LPIYYMSRNRLLFAKTHKFISGDFDRKAWQYFIHAALQILRQTFVLRELSITCLVAHVNGFIDFLLHKFGVGPKWINRPSDEYLENKIRRVLISSHLFLFLRDVKKRLAKSMEANG
jgi:hypothetical protein